MFILLLQAVDMGTEGKLLMDCIAENGVTEQELLDLKSGKTKPEDAKDNMKCATQCVLVKSGFMNDKGTVLTKKFLDGIPDASMRAKVEKDLASCVNTKGANPCDTAYQITSCMAKQSGHIMP